VAEVRRSELYALVWSRPILTLSKEFGLSSTGLKKVCKRYGIPVPYRGYWARLEAGQRVPVTDLPTGVDVDIKPFGSLKPSLAPELLEQMRKAGMDWQKALR